MLQQGGRGEKLPDEICYSESWWKITQEIPSACQTQQLSWVVCTDRFSVLLKSALTHYVFLQRGRKGPQRTKWGKADIIAQVNNLLPTHRRVFAHASFCFWSELNLCKGLYVSNTTANCCIFCDFVHFYIPGLHLISTLFCPSLFSLVESDLYCYLKAGAISSGEDFCPSKI